MQKRKIAYLFLVLFGLIFLASCEYETIQPLPAPTGDISYSADIQPIWDGSCVGCHGQGLTPPDLRASVSYSSLIDGGYVNTSTPESSTIYTCLISGGTMAGKANNSQVTLILTWIQQGAKNN
jgi:hypothetical protein